MHIIPTVKLLRIEESDRGTFGIVLICNKAFCVSLENPNILNEQNVSSIPEGQYICKRVMSPKFGNTFEVQNVPNRSYILFHSGNRIEDTSGCILLAQHFGKLYGDRAVLNSGQTFKKFINGFSDHGEFSLIIKRVF